MRDNEERDETEQDPHRASDGACQGDCPKANYNGTIEVWYSKYRNEFRYLEIVGLGTIICEDDSTLYIGSVEVREK